MKKYFGVKIVDAEPMNLGDYNLSRGWTIPYDEDPKIPGSRVVYEDGYVSWFPEEAFNGPLDGGCYYISWSPRDVFESAYNAFEGLTFGSATEAAKKRLKVGRKGWNGKGMYVVIMPGYPGGVPVDESTAKIHNVPVGTVMKIRPYWVLYTAQGDCAMWAPSGSDSLAEDWEIVE